MLLNQGEALTLTDWCDFFNLDLATNARSITCIVDQILLGQALKLLVLRMLYVPLHRNGDGILHLAGNDGTA